MRVRVAGLLLFAALGVLLVWNAVTIGANLGRLSPRGVGDDAPALVLRPVEVGGPTSLAELRGRVVLIDFWATWCAPCRRSMPAVERLWQKYRNQGLTVVSINVENDPARARAFAVAHRPPLTFPMFVDDGAAEASYHVDAIPHVVLIDKAGHIAAVHVGGFDEDELGERIAALTR